MNSLGGGDDWTTDREEETTVWGNTGDRVGVYGRFERVRYQSLEGCGKIYGIEGSEFE